MHDPYSINATDHLNYDKMFRDFDEDKDGYLSGSEVVKVFSQSGLDVDVLRKVWELADADKDSKLNSKEFAVGFHLIVCVRNKKLPLPDGLTPGLLNFLANAPDMPQPQSQAQPTGIQTPPPGTTTVAPSVTTPARAAAAETLVSVAQQPITRPQTMSIDDAFSNMDSDLSNDNRSRIRTASNGSQGDAGIPPALTPTTATTPMASSSAAAAAAVGAAVGASSPMPMSTSMPLVGQGQVNEINDGVNSVLDSSKRAMAVQRVASETTEKAIASLKTLSVKLGTEKVSMSASLNGAEQDVQEMERRLADVLQDVASMSQQNESLRSQLKEITSKQTGTEQSLFTAKEQHKTLTKENEGLQASIAAAERDVISFSMKLGESTEALDNANANAAASHIEANKVAGEISALQSEIASLRSINTILMTRKNGVTEELEGLRQRATAAETAVATAQEIAKEMESKVNNLTKEKENLQQEKSKVIEELAAATDAAEVAKAAADNARKEAEKLAQENAKMNVAPEPVTMPTPTTSTSSSIKSETVIPVVETKKEESVPAAEKKEPEPVAEPVVVVKPPTPPPEANDDPFTSVGSGVDTGSNGGSGASLSSLGDFEKDSFADTPTPTVEEFTPPVADSTKETEIDPFTDTGFGNATSAPDNTDPFGDVSSPIETDNIDPFGSGNGPSDLNGADPFGGDSLPVAASAPPSAPTAAAVDSTDPFGDNSDASPADSTDPFGAASASTGTETLDPFGGDVFGGDATASAFSTTTDPFGGNAFGEAVGGTDINTGNAFGEFNAFGSTAAAETDSSKAGVVDPFATTDFGAFDDTSNTDNGSVSTDAFASFPDANSTDNTNLGKAFDAF